MDDEEIIEKAKSKHFEIMNVRVNEDYNEWQTREAVEETLKETILLARKDQEQRTLHEMLEWLEKEARKGNIASWRTLKDFKEKFKMGKGVKQ